MGVMLMNGMNGPADFGRAGTLLRRACALGSQSGCFNLGQMLTKGPDQIRYPGAADAAHKEYCRLRSEDYPSELQSLMRQSYAVFCMKKQKHIHHKTNSRTTTQTNYKPQH